MEPTAQALEALACDVPKLGRRAGEPEAAATATLPNHLRPLKGNEVVSRGDFVADEHQGFELWEGPAGFRADSFVKPIYRRNAGHPPGVKK